ncbi:MAG: hypothetical protein LQ352_002782 [Teloschistes flavicans]|nr:MAG: hypothetical protein LQ352_002782 [Teloschistes flavicans]
MPPGYSLHLTVSAIHSFYTFLTTLPSDITPDSILSPSSGPWPSLTPQYLSPLHKSPTVLTLLTHLPYINENTPGCIQTAYQTQAIDFTGSTVRWSLSRAREREAGIEGLLEPPLTTSKGERVILPEWVVCLSTGGREGSWLLLDTHAGTMTDYIQQERPERDEPGEDSPDFWRAYHTLPITEFFEEWKEKYRRLEWVVVPQNVDDGVMIRHDSSTNVSAMSS